MQVIQASSSGVTARAMVVLCCSKRCLESEARVHSHHPAGWSCRVQRTEAQWKCGIGFVWTKNMRCILTLTACSFSEMSGHNGEVDVYEHSALSQTARVSPRSNSSNVMFGRHYP